MNSNEDIFGATSLALDTTGHAHIGYFEETKGELKYATNASGSWVTTTVDSDGDLARLYRVRNFPTTLLPSL